MLDPFFAPHDVYDLSLYDVPYRGRVVRRHAFQKLPAV